MKEIIEVNHGIANSFKDHIEVNKHIKKYPKLYNEIIKHELSHTNKFSSLHDLKLDFLPSSNIRTIDLLNFMFHHPSSFTQFLPIYYTRKKGFVYDLNLMIMYLISASFLFFIIYIGGKIL